jgi:hypothetical protein
MCQAAASLRDRRVIGYLHAPLEVCAFQLGKPVLKLVRFQGIDVKRDHLGELGGLIRRDIAGCRGGYDGGGGSDRIGGLGKGRQLAKQRLVSSRGHESIQAQSKRLSFCRFIPAPSVSPASSRTVARARPSPAFRICTVQLLPVNGSGRALPI